jgi:hypothetical protein
MNKFEKGEKVRLLDKTCGPIKGLKNTLNPDFRKFEELIPSFGTITSEVKNSYNYGPHYKVTPDPYDSKVHKHKNMMFYESDLARVGIDWIEDDLFVI